jgi:hypothetical protein
MNPLPHGRSSDFALAAAKTPEAKTALQYQIDATDRHACPDAGGIDRRTSDTEVGRYGSTA